MGDARDDAGTGAADTVSADTAGTGTPAEAAAGPAAGAQERPGAGQEPGPEAGPGSGTPTEAEADAVQPGGEDTTAPDDATAPPVDAPRTRRTRAPRRKAATHTAPDGEDTTAPDDATAPRTGAPRRRKTAAARRKGATRTAPDQGTAPDAEQPGTGSGEGAAPPVDAPRTRRTRGPRRKGATRTAPDPGAGTSPDPDPTSTAPRIGAAVSAEGFGLDGPRGPVFQGITFDAEPNALIAVEGPSGSGRTCLLLALTGRMKAGRGHARVGRYRLPKQLAAVRGISALGPVPGVTDLDPALTVTEHLRERVLLQRRFGGSLRALFRPRRERAAASRARLEAALTAAGLDLDALPKGPRTHVRSLERPDALRLSLALALLGEPRLLAVDDTDLKLSEEERGQVWATLRAVAESGTTVLAVCSQAPEGAVVVRTDAARDDKAATGEDHDSDSDDGEGRRAKTNTKQKGEAADALAEASRA